MQKLFTAFPDRWPGIALLVLRNALAAMLLAGNVELIAVLTPHAIVACISAGLLCPGLFTPMASVVSATLWLVDIPLVGARLQPFDVFYVAVAAVLAVLGPGAYSVDARLFGRRVLVLWPGSLRSKRH